jgi:hypothetical protein
MENLTPEGCCKAKPPKGKKKTQPVPQPLVIRCHHLLRMQASLWQNPAQRQGRRGEIDLVYLRLILAEPTLEPALSLLTVLML